MARFRSDRAPLGLPPVSVPYSTGEHIWRSAKESAEKAAASGMEGNAIGGLSVGEPAGEMYRIIEVVNGFFLKINLVI